MKEFSDVIRKEITNKNEIRIDKLGLFKLEHKKQFQKQFKNGRVVMMPPKDTIKFVPETE